MVDRRVRRALMSTTLWGWYAERLASNYHLSRLGLMLTRAIGASAACAHWRLMVDKRKRHPRPADCPTVTEGLRHCLIMYNAKRILFTWRRHVRRMVVRRQQAATKIQSAAKPTNLCVAPSATRATTPDRRSSPRAL